MNLLNKLTSKNLKLNKKRTIVTIIGIMLSVALITAVAAMFFSARDSIIKYQIREQGNFHYSFNDVPESDIKYFEENRNLEAIYYTKNIGYAKLEESKNKNKPYAFIKAFDYDALKNLAINLTSGRLPENDSEVLITTHLKTNGRIDYKIGDTLTLEVGKRITKDPISEEYFELKQSNPYSDDETIIDTIPQEYKIVGIIERPSYSIEEYTAPGYTFVTLLDDNNKKGEVSIYTRYTKEALKKDNIVTANILDVDEEAFTYLYYDTHELSLNAEDMISLEKKLGEFKYDYDKNYNLTLLEKGIFNDGSMKALGSAVAVVVAIIIFTSVFCIKNSFNISITEKVKQYGMLRTVGATSKQIKKNVYYEALMLGLVGIPLGIACGLLASFILIKLTAFLIGDQMGVDLIYSFSWLSILFSILLGLVTLYLSAWGSAHKASKITPLTAIRNSEDLKVNPKKIKSPKYIKKIFGIGGVVSYKNLKRNKKKYRATVISIIVCSSVFIALSAFVNLVFDYAEREYEARDYNILLSYDVDEAVAKRARDVVNLENIDDYSISAEGGIFQTNDKIKFSSEYLKVFPEKNQTHTYTYDDGRKEEYYEETPIKVYRIGEHAYQEYLNKLGIKEDELSYKGILINTIKVGTTNNKGIIEEKTISMLDYQKGDTLNFQKISYEYDENLLPIPAYVDIDIIEVTTEVPFGIINRKENPILIVNDETFYDLFKEIPEHVSRETISIYSSNATKLQDQIEEHLTGYDSYSLYNSEESVKEAQAFYLLLAIFLYGFITVIALIGITNIFNTITTNMELRSREFATLKSIGMTRQEFNRMIRLESFFYGTKALLIGIPIGSIIAYYIHKLLTQDDLTATFKLPTTAIIISILAVFILITCIMKYSINKINKQNTIETIRNENI